MKLSVAAVQMESRNGDFEGNRTRAEKYIEEAARKGARLISLPEFALAGYIYEDSIWDAGEPLKGRTYRWLRGLCDKHKVYIATCILEKDGEDFFDTFILCGPGEQLWVHRKVEPAAYEAFFFKGGGRNADVFDTPIGRIGIVICFDSSKTYSMESLKRNRPDLLLMQFSCPEFPKFFPRRGRCNWIDVYKAAPYMYAGELRAPVVVCNKTGAFDSSMPLGFGIKYNSVFIDESLIIDKDGNLLAGISKKPGMICADVEKASKDDEIDPRVNNGRWYLPYSFILKFVTEFTQKTGKLRYACSSKRKRAAAV